jgi:sugar lactone lactonase YvrE
MAVSDDALWVGDADQRLVYRLDKSGVPQGTLPVTVKGTIEAMAWDGEALRVAVGDYSAGVIARIDGTGGVVESFPIPFKATGLGWDAANSTIWTAASAGNDQYLLWYSADGRLLQILSVGTFGTAWAMTWAPDGFWVVTVFGQWHRFDLLGTSLRDEELPMEVFGSEMGIARDADGSVWLAVAKQKKIYKFATRTEKMGLVPTSTPNTGGPGSSGGIPGALALPHPALDDMPGQKATVIVTNNLGGTMTLSFDYSDKHETAILQPGETWTAYLEQNSYSVFFSANAPKPVAYAGKMLILKGYQYTWDVQPPK